MSEPRCPGCHHPEPLHTMSCDYRNPLYPILTDLIAELRVFHQREGLLDYCQLCSDDEWVTKWPCDNAKALDRAKARLREVTG